jgi:P27 family predicted phage terminase small subunit
MAGPRQPINLVLAKGKAHLTKEQIEERQRSELRPNTEGIEAPTFLTAKQRKEFNRISGQLERLGIMGETDCDTLARYVVAQDLYAQAVKELRKLAKDRPENDGDPESYYALLDIYYKALDNVQRQQDKYFKQAQTAAAALGLTISSRCKLVAPAAAEEPKQNKFKKFGSA